MRTVDGRHLRRVEDVGMEDEAALLFQDAYAVASDPRRTHLAGSRQSPAAWRRRASPAIWSG
ncbi:MAG TPA: hypothetical protein VGH33_11040 [Isosphaeraceae bacterium]